MTDDARGELLAHDMVTLLDHAVTCLEETMTGRTSKIQVAVSNINLVKDTLRRAAPVPQCDAGSAEAWCNRVAFLKVDGTWRADDDSIDAVLDEFLDALVPPPSEAGREDELAEWKQAASVEAGLRREFLARAETAEAQLASARKALEPFAINVGAVSLSKALGHITREHLLAARAALSPNPGTVATSSTDRGSP